MKAKLSDFKKEGDDVFSMIDYPLFRAMAAGVKELEVTPEEFVMAMRYAVMNNVYLQIGTVHENYPSILAMKISII